MADILSPISGRCLSQSAPYQIKRGFYRNTSGLPGPQKSHHHFSVFPGHVRKRTSSQVADLHPAGWFLFSTAFRKGLSTRPGCISQWFGDTKKMHAYDSCAC
jgi:hypothetical protein